MKTAEGTIYITHAGNRYVDKNVALQEDLRVYFQRQGIASYSEFVYTLPEKLQAAVIDYVAEYLEKTR